MNEITVNEQLLKEDLFILFHNQLRKDFESSGIDIKFVIEFPRNFEKLKNDLIKILLPLINHNSSLIPILLYRVDISETQLINKQNENFNVSFEELLAELIIKRVLQKVVLKKTFSKNK